MKNFFIIFIFTLLLVPSFVHADIQVPDPIFGGGSNSGNVTPVTPSDSRTFAEVITGTILPILGLLIPLVSIMTLLVFFWGLAKFIFKVGGSDSEVENGKKLMIWGIVGLFVMLSLWGIVGFISKEFDFEAVGIPQLPTSN